MAQPVAEAAEAGVALVKLMAGSTVASLAIDGAERRAAALRSVLDDYVEDGTRVVWVGNPLRAPLTIDRFLIQIVGPEVDLRVERGPAELATLLAGAVGDGRLLVVVQQPETIAPDALELLGAVLGHLAQERAPVQFLFVGTAALRLPGAVRPPPEPVAPPLPPETAPRRAGREVFPILLLAVLLGLGLYVGLRPPAAAPPQAAPARLADADVGAIRHEFDRMMAERARTGPRLTAAERDALFAELMSRLRR